MHPTSVKESCLLLSRDTKCNRQRLYKPWSNRRQISEGRFKGCFLEVSPTLRQWQSPPPRQRQWPPPHPHSTWRSHFLKWTRKRSAPTSFIKVTTKVWITYVAWHVVRYNFHKGSEWTNVSTVGASPTISLSRSHWPTQSNISRAHSLITHLFSLIKNSKLFQKWQHGSFTNHNHAYFFLSLNICALVNLNCTLMLNRQRDGNVPGAQFGDASGVEKDRRGVARAEDHDLRNWHPHPQRQRPFLSNGNSTRARRHWRSYGNRWEWEREREREREGKVRERPKK